MDREIYVLAENYHQLLKGEILKKLDPRIRIFYSGNARLISQSGFDVNFEFIKKSEFLKLNLDHLLAFVFFTTHGTKENFLLLRFLREKGIPIICFQESHQLLVQRENIYNIILSPDLIIAASSLEAELISKKQLFEKNKIIDPGWVFKNKIKKNIEQSKRMLIILGASNKIAPSSPENLSLSLKLINFLKSNFNDFDISIKQHPQESVFKLPPIDNNINFISYSKDVNLIHQKYKIIFCSENTQAALDLMQIRDVNLISFGNPGLFFETIDSKANLVPNSNILIKEYLNKEHFHSISWLFNSNKSDKKFEFDRFIGVANKFRNYSLSRDALLWEAYFAKQNLTDAMNQFLDSEDLSSDYKILRASLKNASEISIIYLIEIERILNHQIKNSEKIQNFIDEFLTPINVQNYIYETLLMYIFLIRNNPEIEFNKEIKGIIKNIYESVINKILIKLRIYRIPEIMSFVNLRRNKLITIILPIFIHTIKK